MRLTRCSTPAILAADENVLLSRGASLLDRREARPAASHLSRRTGQIDETQDPEYAESFDAVERALDELAAAEGLSKRDLEERTWYHDKMKDTKCGKGAHANRKYMMFMLYTEWKLTHHHCRQKMPESDPPEKPAKAR